jgi:copper resistance protein B
MRPTSACLVALAVGIVTGGWTDTSHAQPSGAGRVESVVSAATGPQHPQSPGAGQDTHSAPQRPPDPETERQTPVTPIPRITDADRTAAFPDVEAHAIGDDAIHYFVLFDQLEWHANSDGGGMTWNTTGWVGRDVDRLWLRTEGDADDGRLGGAEAHLLYGRAFARWWDVVVGVRQDFQPGPAQSWLAVGIQGLAPYWFEVEATAYLGAGGRTAARLEAKYELLFTNRLVLQPLVELNLYGKTNAERRIGAGLSSFDAGLRVRYEFRREFAPYVGVTWRDTFGDTSRFAEAAGEPTGGLRVVAGLRLWF